MFGYGSLICPKSRATTAPSLINVVAEPAIIANIERSWCVRVVTGVRVVTATSSSSCSSSNKCNGRGAETTATTPTTARQQQQQQTSVRRIGYTPAGVQFKHGAECNGVLMHISEDELRRFDEREGKFYTRRRAVITDIRRYYDSSRDGSVQNTTTATTTATTSAPTEKDVKCSVCKEIFDMASSQRNSIAAAAAALTTSSNRLEHSSSSNNNNDNDIAVWIYVPKSEYTAFATPSCPIIQSYIDIIIRGCLSISNDFARQFLLSTQRGWRYHGCYESNRDDNKGEDDDDDDIAKKNVVVVVRSDETTGGSSSAADNSSNDVGGRYHHHDNMWVNDRSSPIYTRADIDYSMMHGQLIDELIEEYHHSALQQRMDIH